MNRDEEHRQRQLRYEEANARDQLVCAYLAAKDGLARAVLDAEAHEAMTGLRRVNEVLREHGYKSPLGAAGVEDVFAHMGEVQLHEEEVPVALHLMRLGADALVTYPEDKIEDKIVRRIISKLEHAAGEQA